MPGRWSPCIVDAVTQGSLEVLCFPSSKPRWASYQQDKAVGGWVCLGKQALLAQALHSGFSGLDTVSDKAAEGNKARVWQYVFSARSFLQAVRSHALHAERT